jgi:eukaryotic-like serine/threonine-protein kinase
VGDTLGIWKMQRELGHGGMGYVYLVERCDGHYTQTAALKFLRGLSTTETLAFFTRERQLLATLSHPNIARLLDGGAADNGQPYLVMEYVDGIHIDQYCRQRRLDIPAVIALFTVVCEAVAFAHRKLVVHCDLKPSNVLIEKSGRPVLLDFGIARLIDEGHTDDVSAVGGTQARSSTKAYTPKYASPELKENTSISTASDVYSLGVLLNELCVEAATYSKRTYAGSATRVREREAIIRRATQPDPQQRYQTVEDMVVDIKRYLANSPVQAIVPSPNYLAHKFLVRNWPVVLAGSLFLVTTAGFTAKVMIESQRARAAEVIAVQERDATLIARRDALTERDIAKRERDRAAAAEQLAAAERNAAKVSEQRAIVERDRAKVAEERARKDRDRASISEANAVVGETRARQAEAAAKQTSDFLVSIFNNSNPTAESGDIPASKLIAVAEARVESEMKGQPQTQSDLYLSLSAVNTGLGSHRQARKNLQNAVEIERKLNRPLMLADLLGRLARIDANFFGGKEAVQLATEAVVLAERHARADSAELANALMELGNAKDRVGNPAEAMILIERALAILEKINPMSAGTAHAHQTMAMNLYSSRQYSKAVSHAKRALAIRESLFGMDDISVLTSQEAVALNQGALKQFDEAESAWRRLLQARRKLHGEFNARYTTYYLVLSGLMTDTGRPNEAMEFARLALTNAEKTVGKDNSGYLVSMSVVAYVHEVMGNTEEAIRLMKMIVAAYPKVHPATHTVPARYERNLGRALMNAGRADEGLPHLQISFDMYKRIYGEKHRSVANAILELAKSYAQANKLDEARAWIVRFVQQPAQTDAETRANEAEARAIIAAKSGNVLEALEYYQTMERATSEWLGSKESRYWISMLPRARLLATRNMGTDSADARDIALKILTNITPLMNPEAPIMAELRRLSWT